MFNWCLRKENLAAVPEWHCRMLVADCILRSIWIIEGIDSAKIDSKL